MSHNLLFFRFCKTSKKTTFSVFLSFFIVKSPKSQSLKLNISRTAWPILMILVSFCRILNGRSDKINLFWRCSSPLRHGDFFKGTKNQHCLSLTPFDQNMIRNQSLSFFLTILSVPENFQGSGMPISLLEGFSQERNLHLISAHATVP